MKNILLLGGIALFFNCVYMDAADRTQMGSEKHIAYKKYKILDLGTLGSEYSRASAINENGQILGHISDRGTYYVFIWSIDKGLEILSEKIPLGELKLNNKGQISGTYYDNIYQCRRSFVWDQTKGLIDIGSLGGTETRILAFNDNCQIIGMSKMKNKDDHIFLWNEGIMTDITAKFQEQIPGNWSSISPAAINNHGTIIINAVLNFANPTGNNLYAYKSFFFKNNQFIPLLPEEAIDTSVSCRDWDDNDNALVDIREKNQVGGTFIINGCSKIMVHSQNCVLINNLPCAIDELPGELKKDVYGNFYYGRGINIMKLLNIQEPFCAKFRETPLITDHNSKGHVIGIMDTIHSGYHAFLAIPDE